MSGPARWLLESIRTRSGAPLSTVARDHRSVMVLREPGLPAVDVARHVRPDKAGFIALDCVGLTFKDFEKKALKTPRKTSSTSSRSSSSATTIAFLDNLESLAPEVHAPLHEVIAEATEGRQRRVRIVAAAAPGIREHALGGRFSLDLYMTLWETSMTIAPIRERMADFSAIVEDVLMQLGACESSYLLGFDECARSRLERYAWRGNLTELRSVIRLALERSGGGRVKANDLVFDDMDEVKEARLRRSVGRPAKELPLSLDELRAMKAAGTYSLEDLEKLSGLKRSALYARIKK